MYRSFARLAGYVIGFGSLFAIWHIASVYLLNSILFPAPGSVVVKAIELAQDGTLWENASISLQRIALGFFFGSAIGIPLGLAIGSFGLVRRILEPYTEFLRFIPATALITVAVIWFGIGEGSKIFLIIYTTVFIVIINTAAGVSAVAPNKIRAARSLGANRAQVFGYVALPATVPYILTGMRLAMGNSFVTIIAAELVAANAGLGKMIWDARLYMLVDQIFVALLVLGLLGFTADRLFRWGIYAFAGRFSPVT
jgi:ABC-type nitrate/sulfonate/bicarbonate transport system permease component